MTKKEKYLREILHDIIEMKDREIEEWKTRYALKGTGWSLLKDNPRAGEVYAIHPEYFTY
jgi:hypothetical protein